MNQITLFFLIVIGGSLLAYIPLAFKDEQCGGAVTCVGGKYGPGRSIGGR